MREVSHAVQLRLDRNRDLLLHFFRRTARPLRDDPNILVGDVGIGFDGQVVERNDSPDEQQHAHGQHEHAVSQRKINQRPDHAALFLRRAGKLQCIGHDLVARFQSADHLAELHLSPALQAAPLRAGTGYCPRARYTQSLSCKCTTADAGTTTRSTGWRLRNVAVTNIPARMMPFGIGQLDSYLRRARRWDPAPG